MLRKAFYQGTEENRLIGLVLTFALVFAALHVALHELDVSSSLDRHEKCEVCRLSQVPTASLPLPALHAPLQSLQYVLPITNTISQLSNQPHILRVRAPPLF